ncbi:MAG TPA: LLM class flavin-dependent oxidoreductase [Chloroflexota bacterium]|nr:LLM class flavin-dependent oxidoreductase [Chloroflexota bacterium]
MKLGYFTMPLHPPPHDPAATMAEDLEQIQALEELGFEEAWIGEHISSEWENIPAPDLFIAHALAKTSRIKLGTGVNCLPNHTPLMLAQRIAQLDQMAGGRFLWGVGSGGFPGDFQVLDMDPASQVQRGITRQILNEILDLWGEPEPGVREGERWHYRVPEPDPQIGIRLHMRPKQRPHPPIGVAGIGPKSDMLTLAGERGWIPMSINVVTTPVLKAHWQTYSESAARTGATADRACWRICRDVYVGDTSEQARRDVIDGVLGRDWREYFIPVLTRTNTMMGPKVDPSMPDEAVTPEYLAENLWIVGDVDEVAAKLRKLYDDVGGFGTLLVIGHEWRRGSKWHRSMERLATEVLPRLP